MKQTLALRMGTQLSMTPQLQQAIRLMQLSALELDLEIRQAIESNPMLELVEDDADPVGADLDDADLEGAEGDADLVGADDDSADEAAHEERSDDDDPSADATEDWDDLDGGLDSETEPLDNAPQDIPTDLPVDVSWDDVYQPTTPADTALGGGGAADDDGFEERNGTAESLASHLLWQLQLLHSAHKWIHPIHANRKGESVS